MNVNVMEGYRLTRIIDKLCRRQSAVLSGVCTRCHQISTRIRFQKKGCPHCGNNRNAYYPLVNAPLVTSARRGPDGYCISAILAADYVANRFIYNHGPSYYPLLTFLLYKPRVYQPRLNMIFTNLPDIYAEKHEC